jgi:hypothetical protein
MRLMATVPVLYDHYCRSRILVPNDTRDDKSETQGHFCVMIVILFPLSAALTVVMLLFDGSAHSTHAAIREPQAKGQHLRSAL